MLTYNTHLKPLILPEYGRTVQSMVDYCCTIEDRDERTRCAYAIIRTMKTLLCRIKTRSMPNANTGIILPL